MSDERIATFESTILMPALLEICESPALARDFKAEIVTTEPHSDPGVAELIDALPGALRRRGGPALVLSDKDRPEDIADIGGHYVMRVLYNEDDGLRVYASPGVIFWMRFNNKLHVFDHRYDNDIAHHNIADVTRPHVLNHVLRSLDFYKLQAFSAEPFPGYGR